MSVYIDDYGAQFGRMLMAHMIADTHEELVAMADKIGVQRKWLQKEGTFREHFDVCKAKRILAIQNGAIQVSCKELVKIYMSRAQPQTEGKQP